MNFPPTPAESTGRREPRPDSRAIRIATPARLHFGLLGFGGSGRQFGGVGAMVREPSVVLRLSVAEQLECVGPLASRTRQFAERWAQYHQRVKPPACRMEVLAAPSQHVGLGVGTQLGLAVAAGLGELLLGRRFPAVELARSVGRGLRSAVGTYGFELGGLIVERGKLPAEDVSPLESRHRIPADWRFLLARPQHGSGLAGSAERQAFAELPAVPQHVTRALRTELDQRMLPALRQADLDAFGESVYRFGHLAGSCFATRQGGPYNGPVLTELVDRIRSLGVRGVGQSSWGPTLFAVLPDQAAAECLRQELQQSPGGGDLVVRITQASSGGATWDACDLGNSGGLPQ